MAPNPIMKKTRIVMVHQPATFAGWVGSARQLNLKGAPFYMGLYNEEDFQRNGRGGPQLPFLPGNGRSGRARKPESEKQDGYKDDVRDRK